MMPGLQTNTHYDVVLGGGMRARRQLAEIETIEHGSDLQSVTLERVWESRSKVVGSVLSTTF